ncbi:MAG: GH92 family glycosyl hydrolase [Prolixibacteraceae bacterium]|nr:GH92 family glycosyl hydrolase [Prolixibacteraceae bacterium]
MNFKRIHFLLITALFSVACSNKINDVVTKKDNTSYVNTFIGTGGHGHTFPGATTPHGMVQLSPDTRTLGWDACGGYHYSDSSIIGFSHTHLSGTGISDLGDILFMPFSGTPKISPGTPENPDSGYRSRFSHNEEKAEPGYYAVKLKDYNIQVELTATSRAGFHRYTFNNVEKNGIIIDLVHTIYADRNPEQEFRLISDTEIEGYKKSGGWAHDQCAYFHAKFNKPFKCVFYDNKKKIDLAKTIQSKKLKAVLTFNVNEGEEILAKVGISSVDYQGAKNNLETEIPGWDFDKVKNATSRIWEKQLDKIKIEGGSEDEKTIFYSSLYHTLISPYLFSDVDGRYLGMDKKIYQSKGKNIYTVFSLWDTFRAFHPLQTIIDPELDNDFINSLICKYDEGGMLPKWELNANYTGTMIGSHAISVIVDAYMKGIRNYDVEKVYNAMVKSMTFDTTGILFPSELVKRKLMPMAKYYNETLGYIPADLENGSVSKALEYAYNDWCIAQMAKELGKKKDYEIYTNLSKRYTKYFDKKTGFMRGKNSDGKWREPFDPRFSRHRKDDYVEGNAYQWTWFVPHDVNGLVELMGGKEQFTANLDTLFSTSSLLTGDEVPSDISGLIGQYAHGNEPSHHISYIYNFVGQSWKTQKLTDQIMSTLYFNNPNGLAGNEDCGQMSAWYVLNAMGFYSFCPGNPVYSLGRPIFDKVEINLPNGNKFLIIAKNNSHKNCYVQSAMLNGEIMGEAFFNHQDILNGGTLEFVMGSTPNKQLFN